jgi:hypothetical protein
VITFRHDSSQLQSGFMSIIGVTHRESVQVGGFCPIKLC